MCGYLHLQELEINKELDAQMVRDLHFGGGDGNDDRSNKTKKDVMEELIAKSKYYKVQCPGRSYAFRRFIGCIVDELQHPSPTT